MKPSKRQEPKMQQKEHTVEELARVGYEVIRTFKFMSEGRKTLAWEMLNEAQKQASIRMVEYIKKAHDQKLSVFGVSLHSNWAWELKQEGWEHGEEYDAEKKTHPELLRYFDLPEAMKAKYSLFLTTVNGMLGDLK